MSTEGPSVSRVNTSTSNHRILVIFSVMLRWIVSFYDYSGQGNPPMFGDYEAQRHWMEVTVNLPVKEWYVHSYKNDLQYWGLDYPPLTAYHSFICGYIAYLINPAYIENYNSRGYESPEHKHFMRITALISDLFTYLPAACLYSKFFGSQSLPLVLLMYPGLILIDHGHFQYNCVSLGLALFAFIAFLKNKDIIGSLLFCLAINYKQMLLYYSLPIFFYLLKKCVHRGCKKGGFYFIQLGLTVIMTFFILWWPFYGVTGQVVKRIFPLDRGLFEDKVSNIWCVINILVKIRRYFDNNQLALMSALITLLAILPSSIDLFRHPTPRKFRLSLINSSLGFFLFSYQVHEKTILLVSLPVMLYYHQESLHCLWFLMISSLSMLPLLLKDNLFIPFIALNIIYLTTLCCFTSSQNSFNINKLTYTPSLICIILSIVLSLALIILIMTVTPPLRYPDLFPLLISVHCAVHFIFFFIYFNRIQFLIIKDS